MNYQPIHTNITPNINYLSAENAFLKQDIEYKNAVLCEQQTKIDALQSANGALQQDAARWRRFKAIIDSQKGDMNSAQLQNIVDAGDRPLAQPAPGPSRQAS